MQELRLLLISLATVLLSSILLFIYFRSRIVKVEEKLEIMFNLIQSHAREEQMTQQFVPYENNVQNTVQENTRVNLIDVSEDEDGESDSDESDSDSDDEMNNLVIDENLLEENIKKIELTLESKDVLFDNMTQENMNHLEDVQTDIIVQKGMEEEYNEEEDNEEEEDEEEEDEDNEEEDNEEEDNEEEMIIDLTKLKVVELRKMCSDNGKTNYKSLKKAELIQLLQN
tara:strand:+ start:911 stop:1591 length:681 start_codon:yes stop_codon:yes gene_type:complete